MEVKTDYKQTEIGIIPEDWAVIPMAELYTFQNGVNADKSAYGKGIPFINVLEVITNSTLTEAKIPGRISLPLQTSSTFRVQIGDVLFNRTSETQEEVGLASVYIDNKEVVFGGFVIRARPRNGRLNPRFSSYALRSPIIRYQIVSSGQGAVRANIGQQELSKVQVFVPPLPEQEAIVEPLSDADALIESLEQLIVKKRLIKKGAMQELLTGKRRLQGFAYAAIDYKQTEVGVIPEDWEVKVFGDLFDISGGFSASRDQLSSEGYCYLHYGDIHRSSKTFIDVKNEYQDIPKLDIPLKQVSPGSLLDDGDVVFVDASEDDEGASKYIVIINKEKSPYISGLHTIVAKSKSASLDHIYRRYCFQTVDVKRQFRYFAVGTKVSGISKTNIAKVVLPVPPLPEQEAIADVLSDMDAEIAALEAKLAKARQLKQGMMHNLLTGRIRLI